MRTLSLLLTMIAMLALASTAGAAKKDCGNLSDTVGSIQARHVTCKRAKKVVKAHSEGTKSPYGFTCKATQYEGGVTFKCRKGIKRVIYSMAD